VRAAGKYKLEKPSKNGQTEVLYSFANSVDTNFALPAGYAAFPFTSSSLLAGAGGTIRTVWPFAICAALFRAMNEVRTMCSIQCFLRQELSCLSCKPQDLHWCPS
jgi:hypothetical protein